MPGTPSPTTTGKAQGPGGPRRPLVTGLLLTSVGAVLALLLALPGLLEQPDPGTASHALPPELARTGPDGGLAAAGTTAGSAGDRASPRTRREPGFEDATASAQLGFRHSFLEREQGYTFQANQYNHGSGVLVGDIDADGWPDLYFLNQMGDNGLWRNLGDGTFEDVTGWSGAGIGDRVCAGGSFADVDNDGDLDLFVTSYRGGNLLFLNGGDGRFEEATVRAGLDAVAHSASAAFFDADNDGDLDLYVVNVGKFTTNQQDPESRYYAGTGLGLYYGLEKGETDFFYRNRGDGTFTDASREVGLTDTSWGADVAAEDLDGDGFVDLYVASMYGEDLILINDGGRRFRNETQTRTPSTAYGAMGAAIADYDGDGDLDVFVSDMHSDMWMDLDFKLRYVRSGARYPTPFGMFDYNLSADDLRLLRALPQNLRVVYGNALLVNDGTGHFLEQGAEAGVETFWPWGGHAADFDLDADLDLFVPSGMGFPWEWWPNGLLVNDGRGHFREEGVLRGFDDPALGHYLKRYRLWNRPFARSVRAGAVLDYDGDGDEDALTNGYNCHATLWRNVFARPGRHWLQLELHGTVSNRDAIGARVTVAAGGRRSLRTVQGAHGYVAQSSAVLTFGLDAAARVDEVEVRWPRGAVQRFTVPAVDARWRLTEGQPDPVRWQPAPVPRRVLAAPLAEFGFEPPQRIPADIVPTLGSRFGMGAAPARDDED